MVLSLVLVAVALVGRVVHRIIGGPTVRIRVISVAGLHTLPKQTVIRSSGIQLGDSLYWINTGQIERRLLTLPGVAAARVEADFPHRLLIRITERQPKLFITHGSKVFYLDQERVVFQSARRSTNGLTCVVGVKASKHDLGKVLRTEHADTAFTVWHGLRRLNLKASIISLTNHRLSARLYDGTEIWFGDESDLSGKLKRLADCWRVMRDKKQHARYVDLRLRELVTWRPRGSEG